MNTDKSLGIFLLFGGLPPTIVESQVFLTCRSMIQKGIKMEIWTFCSSSVEYIESQSRLSQLKYFGVPIFIYRGVKPAVPLSEFINALILAYWLFRNKRKPSFLHCRTDYPTTIAMLIRRIMGSKIVWDSRGDSESEYRLYAKELPFPLKCLSFIKILSIKTRIMISRKYSDACIFVSENLRNLYIKDKMRHSFIIPCTANKKYFYFSEKLRQDTRNKLKLLPSDVVLIYSGSMAQWQCIDETCKLINDHIMRSYNNKAIILTPDREKFLSHFSLDIRNKLICLSVGLNEVNKYLNAADYAVFLRENNTINKVASPVKFAEYCMAGLPVIMTDAVEQSFNYAKAFGNLLHVELGKSMKVQCMFSNEKRLDISNKASLVLSSDQTVKIIFKIYKTLINYAYNQINNNE